MPKVEVKLIVNGQPRAGSQIVEVDRHGTTVLLCPTDFGPNDEVEVALYAIDPE